MKISRAEFQAAIEAGLIEAGERLLPSERDALLRVGRDATSVGTTFSTECVAVKAGLVLRLGACVASDKFALEGFIFTYDAFVVCALGDNWNSADQLLEVT